MSLEGAAVSLGATVISVAFAALVFNQWRSRRRTYQMAWSLGLLMFTVAAFTQFLAETYGWGDAVYRIYYFVAAPLVAVLGVGSAFLLNRRLGLGFALYTVVLGAVFAWMVATAPVDASVFTKSIPGGLGFPESVRLFSPLFTVPGSLFLILIALYSFWRSRLTFNLWIVAGAVVAAGSGSLAALGATWLLYLGDLIGIALMFWGFLASRDVGKAARPVTQEAPSS